MSDLTLEEERARINQMQEETRKFAAEQHKLTEESSKLAAETIKMAAEAGKLAAEQSKLFAESLKLEPDRWWTPALPIAAALGALLGIATFISRLLGH